MRAAWQDETGECEVRAPLSVAISAIAPVGDVRRTTTPLLSSESDTELWLIDLGAGKNRLGGSAFAQVFSHQGDAVPDVDSIAQLRRFFVAIRELAEGGFLLAYHDRSDGGLALTLIEMALASHCGLDVSLDKLGDDPLAALFAEELGAVIQTRKVDRFIIEKILEENLLRDVSHPIGQPDKDPNVRFTRAGATLHEAGWSDLMRRWGEVSYRMRKLRDNPECAEEEYATQCRIDAPGLTATRLTFDPGARSAPAAATARPQVAILREQGVNGQRELAAAFMRAGFEAVDVHMSELAAGNRTLADFAGLAAPG